MPPLLFLLLSEAAAEGGLGPALTPDEALKCKGGCEVHGRGLWEARTLGSCGPDGPAPWPRGGGDSQAADSKAEWTSAGASAWAAEKTLRVTAHYGLTSHPFTQRFLRTSARLPASMWQITRVWDKPDKEGPSAWGLTNNRLVNREKPSE